MQVDTYGLPEDLAGPRGLRVYVNDGEAIYANPPLTSDDDPDGHGFILRGLAELSLTLGRSTGVQPDPLRELVSAARALCEMLDGNLDDEVLRLQGALELFDDLEV